MIYAGPDAEDGEHATRSMHWLGMSDDELLALASVIDRAERTLGKLPPAHPASPPRQPRRRRHLPPSHHRQRARPGRPPRHPEGLAMPEPITLADTRDPDHTVPVVVLPVGTIAALHHTLSATFAVLTDIDCGCGVGERCYVDAVRDEVSKAFDVLTLQLTSVPDHVLADLDHDPAVWIAQLKDAVEQRAQEAGA